MRTRRLLSLQRPQVPPGCGRRLSSLLLIGLLTRIIPPGTASADIGDLSADGLIGQSSFTDATALAIGPDTFGKPAGLAIDSTRKRLYVSDSINHRVLGWSNADALIDGAPADVVIGQPDFSSFGCNRSIDGSKQPITMESLCQPAGLAVDGAGNLYVVDSSNCRVLVFDDPFANDQKADRVLGQADGSCNGTIVNASRLFIPRGVAVDGAGNVYVADGLCRVLEFDGPLSSTDAVADRVYGQSTFTSGQCGGGGLYSPQSLAIDSAGHLYVGSTSLVYEFDTPLGAATTYPTANRTLGSAGCNTGSEGSATTCFPIGVATDSAGHLFVADALNSRVLEYDAPLAVNQADRVFGQPDFGPPAGGTTFCGNEACNVNGPSGSSLCLGNYSGSEISCGVYSAAAVAVDGADHLWVADGFNNRVVRYDNPLSTDRLADLVLGQPSMASIRRPVIPLDSPSVGLSEWNFRALAVDTNNSRVLAYGSLGGFGDPPIGVFGQSAVYASGCNTGGVSAGSLCNPTAAVVSNDRLWIADTGNNRVLRFDPPWLVWDYANQRYIIKRDADHVLGQPDFKSNTCRLGADGLCGPQGIALDAHGNLYISDTGNNRILLDQNPLTTDRNAERVYGQPNFDSRECKPDSGGADQVCDPRGIAVQSHVDPWGVDQGDDLYIADRGNNRVVLYASVLAKPPGAGADRVFGQSDRMDTGRCSQGADGLCHPTGVAVDRGGNLLVADTDNNRVLEYTDPLTDTKADRVFGQVNFTDHACNAGDKTQTPAADTLCRPAGVAASGAYEGNVLVADTGNNRILRFAAPYCIESFSLTAANRGIRNLRSKPVKTTLKIKSGSNPTAADVEVSDRLVLLERDGGIYANDPPLFTLATDSTFSAGIVFKEAVPPWIHNVRVTANGGTWTTDDLELSRGITFYKIKTSFYIPRGFSDAPQYDRVTYNAKAVGLDLSGFASPQWWFRGQFGSTCFTTELTCRATGRGTKCSPAR